MAIMIRPELLLSLPPNMRAQLAACHPRVAACAFASSDPPQAQLGSGGGTAHLLHAAWQARSSGSPFEQWITAGQKIALHGGGESRRLPAYASIGKLFIPIPVLRWARGQRLGQTLLDLNLPFLEHAFHAAGPSARLMIASGDVLLRSNERLRNLPDADVVLLGMWASPEVAQNYGVMFVHRHNAQRLATFLQKPTPDEIRERSRNTPFLIDIGAWLLSQRATACLMSKCGWHAAKQRFADGDVPQNYDLYGQWALHLGEHPRMHDSDVSALSVAVAPIEAGEFYHFGTSADLIESMYALQNIVRDQTRLGPVPSLAQPRQFIQDAAFDAPLRRQANESLWVENSCIPKTWSLGQRHVLTGVPDNDWALNLPDGTCLDFSAFTETSVAVRAYGFSDRFRGAIADDGTRWLERPAMHWFRDRGISLDEADISPSIDLQLAPLFPVLDQADVTEGFIQWLISPQANCHDADTDYRLQWLSASRVSAREISHSAVLQKQYADRAACRRSALPVMAAHGARSVFYKLDLHDTAKEYAAGEAALPAAWDAKDDVLLAIHDRMFRAQVRKRRGESDWQAEERECFRLLEEAVVAPYRRRPRIPECQLGSDQIVWARSPVRVDLAGGWTDTPPYCLEHGGSVVNVALDLNGQPPVQAFARRCDECSITIRSIDLGISETLTDYDQIGNYRGLESGFSVAKAALALCGFHPNFNGEAFGSLAEQLDRFGGGVDVSMLAAIPKGSGLGTSSILAGTLLGSLSELCGFNWDTQELAARVSAVEQMLGSGGGWQDQLGGLLRGAKMLQTSPGMNQHASVRWLPIDFFESPEFVERGLLYYTGITRVAHDVLGEIVRGMFLNEPGRLEVLAEIGANAGDCFDAAQRCHLDDFAETIARSWELNKRLDSGTNPAEVEQLVQRIAPRSAGFKLAGAGGGGFVYIIAKDRQQALDLRTELEAAPPNARARFVEMTVSRTGLQVTRS